MTDDPDIWAVWLDCYLVALASDEWWPAGDPGDTPAEAVAREGWAPVVTDGVAVLACDPERERLVLVAGGSWPRAVVVETLGGEN